MGLQTAAGSIERERLVPGIDGYEDFVVSVTRKNARWVAVRVVASPAGAMAKSLPVELPAHETAGLRAEFIVGAQGAGSGLGQALITREKATSIGKRLAQVLFPGIVFVRFAESLAWVAARPGIGLRIRLAMDESLIDLPWEYVLRPDRLEQQAISGFLLLDPSVSMVRHKADDHFRVAPVTGRQKLDFVGALWEGGNDHWSVREEFALLRKALAPVAPYLDLSFSVAAGPEGLGAARRDEAAIFHYAGHCDFDPDGHAYMIREVPVRRSLTDSDVQPLAKIASALAGGQTRLAVLSACNSGYRAVVQPLLDAGVAAVVGVNGGIDSPRAIEFCAKLYESLAVGLSLDEAVSRARTHLMEQGFSQGRFDWGLFMVHMPCADATLFPRHASPTLTEHRRAIRKDHAETIDVALQRARAIDGMNFGEIMSELSNRRVLILGRFTGRRLEVLKRIEAHLKEHANRYVPELFTFDRPESRDLVESIMGFAALSRFVIADLSEPKSVQSELEAIVPHFQSVPVVPLINRNGNEYATFDSVRRRPNVVQPTIRYRDVVDLLHKLDEQVLPLAEEKLRQVRPPA